MKGARLLCVVAHPDDECVAFGGSLALAARQGAEVSILCFTDGQAATNRGAASTPAELGAIRRREFEASCRVLGAHRHEILDYQDGQLEHVPLSETAGLLVDRIRRWQPHIVVTFGLDGAVNTHPDHSVVSALTSMAFQWAARTRRYPQQLQQGLAPWTPQKLYHLTTSYTLPEREHLSPTPWSLTLDVSSVVPIKIQAFEQHTSQIPIMDKFRTLWEQKACTEHYTLLASTLSAQMPLETTMFEGLHLETDAR